MEKIVRLSLNDLEAIAAFDKICFPEDHTKSEMWIELLEDERTYVFAFKENNQIIAHIAIYNWKGEDDYIKIMTIGTHPDHRKKGYAHQLMQHVIDEMLKEDMRIFKAETRASNLKMQKVFEDFGYHIATKVEKYYDNPTETAFKYAYFAEQIN